MRKNQGITKQNEAINATFDPFDIASNFCVGVVSSGSSGMLTLKVEPFPFLDLSLISPPWRCAIVRPP